MNDFRQKFLAKIENKGNKKTIENLVVFVIILIATIIFINYIWSGDKNKSNEAKETNPETKTLAQTTTSVSSNDIRKRNKLGKANRVHLKEIARC